MPIEGYLFQLALTGSTLVLQVQVSTNSILCYMRHVKYFTCLPYSLLTGADVIIIKHVNHAQR